MEDKDITNNMPAKKVHYIVLGEPKLIDDKMYYPMLTQGSLKQCVSFQLKGMALVDTRLFREVYDYEIKEGE